MWRLGSKILHSKILPKKPTQPPKKPSMQGTDLQSADFNLFSQTNFTEAVMSNVKAMAFAHLLWENGIP